MYSSGYSKSNVILEVGSNGITMLSYEVFGYSDSGCLRRENEDSLDWCIRPDKKMALGVLADGMDGYFGGSVASQLAVKTVVNTLTPFDLQCKTPYVEEIERTLLHAGVAANDAVVQARDSEEAFAEMGTTLVAAMAYGDNMTVIHAGDSRCYRLLDDELIQMTRDDSILQTMLDSGGISSSDVDCAPIRDVLTKSLGIQTSLRFSLQTCNARHGDSFILCSDGLYRTVSKRDIARVLRKPVSTKQQVRELIDRSIAGGCKSNASVVLIKVC